MSAAGTGGRAVDRGAAGDAARPEASAYASCAPEALYRGGGFPGDPDELIRLRRAPAAGAWLEELFPPFRRRRPPALRAAGCGPDFRAHLAALNAWIDAERAAGPACGLVRIPAAILRDTVVYVPRGDGFAVVYETHRPMDRPTVTLAPPAVLAAARPWPGDGPGAGSSPEAAPCLFLGSAGCFNYGHWIVDDLPRLKAFAALVRRHPGRAPVVVVTRRDPLLDEIRRQSIETWCGGPVDVRFVGREEAVAFPALHVATPVTAHPSLKSPDALLALRRRIRARTAHARRADAWARLKASLRAGRLPRRRRLFVDRGPARTRGLRNGDAVFAVLEPLGFERVTLDWISFREQARLFAQAGIVVGNMGAGMANTLFCRAGTPLLYLAPEGWEEPFFWDLAATMAQRYHAVYGPSEGDPFVAPYAVDPALVAAAVADLLRPFPARLARSPRPCADRKNALWA